MKNRGFTLIELVVVLVLVGILAAVALPRFIDLGGRARTAANAGVAGAFESGLNLAASGHSATAPRSSIYPFGTSGYTLTFPIDPQRGPNGAIRIAQWPNSAALNGNAPANDSDACANLFNAFVSGSLAQDGSAILALEETEAMQAALDQMKASGVNYIGMATDEDAGDIPGLCVYLRTDTSMASLEGNLLNDMGTNGFFYYPEAGTVAKSVEELIAKAPELMAVE